MLSYQRNALLSILAQFEAKLYDIKTFNNEIGKIFYDPCERIKIIADNLTSIKKQIDRL